MWLCCCMLIVLLSRLALFLSDYSRHRHTFPPPRYSRTFMIKRIQDFLSKCAEKGYKVKQQTKKKKRRQKEEHMEQEETEGQLTVNQMIYGK